MKRPFLTQEHARKRLIWARAHQHWTVEDWKRVIWSDECAVQKDSNATGVWVFRRQNKQEKYNPRNVRVKARDGYLSQMVWACFTSNKLGPIVFLLGSVNQNSYIQLLEQQFDPFLTALKADGHVNLTFQHKTMLDHTLLEKQQNFLKRSQESTN